MISERQISYTLDGFLSKEQTMINMKLIILAILFLFQDTFPLQKISLKDDWKGKIEYKNGIKVIRNPQLPLYIGLKFKLKENLCLGESEGEDFKFSEIHDIQVDEEGNIYVLDKGKICVQKFNKDGKTLQSIFKLSLSHERQGTPRQMLIEKKSGNILIPILGKNMLTIKIFNKNGGQIRDIIFQNFVKDFMMVTEENIWGIGILIENITHFDVFTKFDFKGVCLKELARFPQTGIFGKDIWDGTFNITTKYDHNLIAAEIDENTIIYGYPKDYTLNVVDTEGNFLFKIMKEETPQSIPIKEKRNWERKEKKLKKISTEINTNFPTHKPFFYALFTDSIGRIYVLRNNIHPSKEGSREFDIFSKDGFLLYNIKLPYHPYIIKDGYLYTSIKGKNKENYVIKRFEILNWSKLKTAL